MDKVEREFRRVAYKAKAVCEDAVAIEDGVTDATVAYEVGRARLLALRDALFDLDRAVRDTSDDQEDDDGSR